MLRALFDWVGVLNIALIPAYYRYIIIITGCPDQALS